MKARQPVWLWALVAIINIYCVLSVEGSAYFIGQKRANAEFMERMTAL